MRNPSRARVHPCDVCWTHADRDVLDQRSWDQRADWAAAQVAEHHDATLFNLVRVPSS